MTVSFIKDVGLLFSAADAACMSGQGVELTSYNYMGAAAGDDTFADHANARHVLARVKGEELPRMPLHAPPWPDDKVSTLGDWINDGFQP